SISFRLSNAESSNFPATDFEYSNYEIYIGESVDFQSHSSTFANNAVGATTQVRSGSLMIPANSFDGGSSPNAFGMQIYFDDTYSYSGGNLLIEIRHAGASGTSAQVDAVSYNSEGYGTRFRAFWGAGAEGLTANFVVIQLNTNNCNPCTMLDAPV